MKRILLVLLFGIVAAALPSYVVAGQAQTFAPPPLFGPVFHPAPLLHPASSVVAPLTLRERNEWEKRRVDQWSELEWQRQQWRENRGEAVSPMDNATTRTPMPATSF